MHSVIIYNYYYYIITDDVILISFRERVQSRTPDRRSVYYSKKDDILQKEISRRNALWVELAI